MDSVRAPERWTISPAGPTGILLFFHPVPPHNSGLEFFPVRYLFMKAYPVLVAQRLPAKTLPAETDTRFYEETIRALWRNANRSPAPGG